MLAAALVLATLLAYAPALGAGFIWDDDAHVTANDTLRDAPGLRRIWLEPRSIPQYYPLAHTTFWLEHQAFGLAPRAYHLTNVLLHALAALLLWRVLRRLELPGALLAASLFALHPVQVESVAWVTERKNVLSGVLYFASLLAWLRFDPLDGTPVRRRFACYGLSLAAFLGALLSKTVTCSLPAVILLLVYWKRGRVGRAEVVPLLPFFALGAALATVTAWLEVTHVGASGLEWRLSALERVLVAGRALWFYAWKLVWPLDLAFSYPRWEIDALEPWQLLFPAAAAAVVLALFALRSRWGRGPLVAALVFAGTLVPALGFFDVYPMRYAFVADHFQYLASVGLLALVAALLARLPARLGGLAGERRVARAGALLLVGVLALLTWRQATVYESPESLWADTLRKNPRSWLAHTQLGRVLLESGRVGDAEPHIVRALELYDKNPGAHNNLGIVLASRREHEKAEAAFRAALRHDPYYGDAYFNLGVLLRQVGRREEALDALARSVALRPSDAAARFQVALVQRELGRPAEAASELERVLALEPGHRQARATLAELRGR